MTCSRKTTAVWWDSKAVCQRLLRRITRSIVCSPQPLSHLWQSTLFRKNSHSHCDHKVFTAQLWGDTSSHNSFSLLTSFQRLMTLRSESASHCSLKKVEVQVGSNLTVPQRWPTDPSQFTGSSLSRLGTWITVWTPTSTRHTHSCDLQPLQQLQRASQGLWDSASAFRCQCPGRYYLKVKSTQEFNPTCKLSFGIFGLDNKGQRVWSVQMHNLVHCR